MSAARSAGPRPAPATPADRPGGLGVAVVFDWALCTQLVTQSVVGALHRGAPGSATGRLVAAAVLLGIGEALRRGVRLAWLLQIGILALVTCWGLGALPGLVQGRIGRAAVLSVLIELTYAPWLIWRLLLPRTIHWFARVPRSRRSPRTTGRWLPALALWSVAWGVLVAISQAL